jgi:hypothetical protein
VVVGTSAVDVVPGVRVAVSDAGVRMVVRDIDQFCDGALRSGNYFYIGAIVSLH